MRAVQMRSGVSTLAQRYNIFQYHKLFLKIIFTKKSFVEKNAPFVEKIPAFVEFIFLQDFDPIFLQSNLETVSYNS